MSKNLLKQGDTYQNKMLEENEVLTPSMERFIVMEWLHRLDHRLVNFVKGKFSTELFSDSVVLVTMVETLAKSIDHFITMLNNTGDIDAVSFTDPSPKTSETAGSDSPMIKFQTTRGGQQNFQPTI